MWLQCSIAHCKKPGGCDSLETEEKPLQLCKVTSVEVKSELIAQLYDHWGLSQLIWLIRFHPSSFLLSSGEVVTRYIPLLKVRNCEDWKSWFLFLTISAICQKKKRKGSKTFSWPETFQQNRGGENGLLALISSIQGLVILSGKLKHFQTYRVD